MTQFRVFLDDGTSQVVTAADPKAAAGLAKRSAGQSITKIKRVKS